MRFTATPALLLLAALSACSGDDGEPPLQGADAIPAGEVERVLTLFNRGVGLMDRYQPTAAVAAFDEVVKLAPGWIVGRLNLGIALLNAQNDAALARAERELKQVATAKPDLPAAHYALALLLLHLGRRDEARAQLEQVLRLDPDDPHANYQMAIAIGSDDATAARGHLLKTLAKIPHHESACYRLQALLRQAGETERADEYLARFQALKESGAGVVSGFKYGEMGAHADTVRTFALPGGTAEGAGALPEFVDVAASAGLTVRTAGTPGWPGVPAVVARDGARAFGPGVAVADVDADGSLDVLLTGTANDAGLYLGAGGRFAAAKDSGLDLRDAVGAFFGDYDGDGDADVYLTCAGSNRLYRNDGGHFADVTATTGTAGGATLSTGAVWVDADHDGDLDLYVAGFCRWPLPPDGALGAPNALWRNNGDGTFTDTAPAAGIDGGEAATLGVLAFDFDGDRDADLLLLNRDGPNALFVNQRLGRYTRASGGLAELASPGTSAALGDVDQDGLEDLLLCGGTAPPRLLRQVAIGVYAQDAEFARVATEIGGAVTGAFGDLDLDGDLDLLLVGTGRHLLRNRGGRFETGTQLGSDDAAATARGTVLADLDGDGMLEILIGMAGAPPELWRAPRPADRHWLSVLPIVKGREHLVEPTAAGLQVEAKVGPRLQLRELVTSSGYLSSPPLRAHFGLGARTQSDYVRLVWSDAVLQSELEVAGDQTWRIDKITRKPSSCPVLFSWDGERFAFVTDVLGVGGVGFFCPPDGYAPPDPTEAVRIPPALIAPRDGRYQLRLAEPLEEVTYFDHLSLRVWDHPTSVELYPDERFTGSAPLPTGRPHVVAEKVFPVAAHTDRGEPVREQLLRIDRRYVEPPKDRRFVGYAADHWLELDFGEQIAALPAERPLVLYLYGWVEYTYSHVNYAAHQAGLAMRPPAIEVADGDGGWRVAIEDAGFPAGLPRMMTVDVSGLPLRDDGRLRLRTNMEVFWDQAFLAVDAAVEVREHSLAPSRAELRAFGYAREFSPDGRDPTIYDYARVDHGVPFKNMIGDYTRFGDVRPLLAEVDDEFVIMGKGEELALEFDARSLPRLAAGQARTVVLWCDGFCKDMDLYTAFPDSVGPLPFHAMENYPPRRPAPDAERLRAYAETWNTRRVR